jgi:predicted nucleotide-binding protein
MRKSRDFTRTKFPPEILRKGFDAFRSLAGNPPLERINTRLMVFFGQRESWDHDTEPEFFVDYRRDHDQSAYEHYLTVLDPPRSYAFEVSFKYGVSTVSVKAPTRSEIESLLTIFEDAAAISKLPDPPAVEEPAPPPPTVFVGHGRDGQWRDLKDHLADKHGYKVEAYESGARAGHTIRDVLGELVRRSSFAILVLTGEDSTADGILRARQNVIHELGLFQGRLGFTRAIALIEEGTEEFSNIHGINQVRFSKGNIREAFGEVLATLRREFGPQ